MKKVSRAFGPWSGVVTMALGGVMACGGGGTHVVMGGTAGSPSTGGSTGSAGSSTPGTAGDTATAGTAGSSTGDAGATGSAGTATGSAGSAAGDAGATGAAGAAAGGTGGADTGTAGTTSDGGAAGGAGGVADMGYTGPFTCTLVAGLLVTSEWFAAGFENDGVTGSQWEGKFQHYGYIDIWAQDPPAGFAWTAPITSACTQNSMNPDRVIFTAWKWEITDEQMYINYVVQDINEFKKNFPNIKRFELSTIVRCPMNKMCNPNAKIPPIIGTTDHNAGQQDCYVAPFIDDALAKVAAMYPGWAYVAPKFESPECENPVNGAHLYMWNTAIAKTIATYYMTNP